MAKNEKTPQVPSSQTWSPPELPKWIWSCDPKASNRLPVEDFDKNRKEAYTLIKEELDKFPNHEEEIKAFYAQFAFENLQQVNLTKLYHNQVALLVRQAAYQSKKSPTLKSNPKLVPVATMPDNTPSNPQDIGKYRKMAFELLDKELSKFPIRSKGLSHADRQKNNTNRNKVRSLYDKNGFGGLRKSVDELSRAYIASLSEGFRNRHRAAAADQGAGAGAPAHASPVAHPVQQSTVSTTKATASSSIVDRQSKKRKYAASNQAAAANPVDHEAQQNIASDSDSDSLNKYANNEMGAPTNPVFSL